MALTEEEYISEAVVFHNNGYIQKAYDSYTQAIRLNPKSVRALIGRGSVLKIMKKYDSAIRDLSQAIKIDPVNTYAYFGRSACYLRLKQYNKAIADCKKILTINPNYFVAYHELGNIYLLSGDIKQGLRCFEIAAKNVPTNALFQCGCGYANLFAGNYRKSADGFKKAYDLNPYHQYFGVLYGLAEQRAGGNSQAFLEKCMKINNFRSWPRPLYELFAGKITPAQCLGKVETADKHSAKEQKCEAYFYIGEYYLIKKDKAKASEYFKKCISTGVDWYHEYHLSKTELKRLGGNK
jgi:tetratricopeptide (TPR) repeat protein